MVRTERNRDGEGVSSQSRSLVSVKRMLRSTSCSYLELTQVPLGEKPKACRRNSCEGIRQISPVTSG